MARMIPPICDRTTTSPGERHIFELLKSDPGTKEWTVLHSLDIAKHRRQVQGELDFLLLVPAAGILVLEVKGHVSVARGDDGLWHLGGDPPTRRSPFRQASDNMHSVRQELARRDPRLARFLYWSAVCFPNAAFGLDSPVEWHAWQAIDKFALAQSPISHLVLDVLGSARRHVDSTPTATWYNATRSLPTKVECEEIAHLLRPQFEFFESPASRRERGAAELKLFTEEQFEVLDAMAANRTVLFEGPAGTGKTLLAIEAARRSSAVGDTVLLCCYNRLLGRWLSDEVKSLVGVHCKTLHSFMLQLTGMQPPDHAPHDFWSRELPEAALDCLLSGGAPSAQFDCLIVDEAQDLLTNDLLDVLDAALDGGLATGRWQFFGDFERQAIYGSDPPDVDDCMSARRLHPARFSLHTNCRSTPRIAALVTLVARLEGGYRKVRRPDNGIEPEWHFYDSSQEQTRLLSHVLHSARTDGYFNSEIVILSRYTDGCSAVSLGDSDWGRVIRPADTAGSGKIRRSSVQAFKGLETPVVIVTDVEELDTHDAHALLYVAMTRPTERLFILARDAVKPQLLSLLQAGRREGEVA